MCGKALASIPGEIEDISLAEKRLEYLKAGKSRTLDEIERELDQAD